MKNFFLKTGLTLLCLIIGLGSAWGDVATLTFTAACSGRGTDSQGNAWTVTSDADESTYVEAQGIHYGTGKKAVSHLTLTCSAITGHISKIVVNASGASGTSAKLSATVGGNNFGTQEQSLTASNAAYTFSGSASGEIEIKASQTSAKKALYVKSIEVTYTTSTTPIDPEVTFNNGSVKATKTLDLSNLFESTSNGAVTYSITSGESFASINGSILTGIAEGSVTVQASQEATSAYNAATRTATITVQPAPTTKDFTLITDADDLQDGMEIIIVGENNSISYALSTTQNSNNRGQEQVSISNDVISISEDSGVQIITLGNVGEYWTLGVDGGYLYAASSSSNYLKTQSTINDNAKWSISISNNTASIVAQGTNTHNVLRYNSTSSIFSCYGSATGQEEVKIYGVRATTPYISADDVNIAADATSGEIEYSITNTVTGKSLSANTTADWISNILVTADKVTFTTTANTTTTERTADFTLTYDGATDKVVTVTQAGKQGDPEITNFIKTSTLELVVGAPNYDIRNCLNIPNDYDTSTYSITTTINGLAQKDGEYACAYPYIAFSKAGEYKVHVVAAAMPGKYAQTEGDITVTVNAPAATITTISDLFTKATEVGGTDTDINLTLNNWVVSGVNGKNAYVTDGANGFIIYQDSHGFTAGNVLNGTVACKVTLYNGSAEIVGLTSTTTGLTVDNSAEELTPTVISDLTTLSGVNTGALIKINNVQYDGTNFTDGTNSIKPYKGIMNTLPELTNSAYYNVTGVYVQYNTTKEISPRSAEDIEEVQAEKYAINIAPCENGTVTASLEEAAAGVEVTLTVTPDSGYQLSTLTATNATTSEDIAVTSNKFIMPAANVNVTATFEEATPSDIIFYESFDSNHGTGGNDGAWSGTIASNDIKSDNEGWTFVKGNGADQCAKFGSGSAKGSATTPALDYAGDAKLTFKAGAWNSSSEKTTLNISIDGDGSTNPTSVTLTKGEWTEYTITLTGLTAGSKIKFEANAKDSNRFFLDKVTVTKSSITPATEYDITIASGIENGTISASKAKAEEGDDITITATPATGYQLATLYYTIDGDETQNTIENLTFTMPASNVTIHATFMEAITGTFTINYSINGIIRKTETLDANASLNFPAVSSMYGKVFLGWTTSEVPDEVDVQPETVGAIKATADATYYALFATRTSTGGSDELTKVDELVAGMDVILAMEEGGTPSVGISDVNIEKSTAVVSYTQSDWLKFSVNEIGDNTCLVYNNLFVTPSTSSKNMFSLSENNGTSFYINSNKHLAYMKGTDEFVLAENYDPNSEDKYYYRFYKESTINGSSSLQTYTPFFVYTDGSSTTYSAYTTLPSYVKLDEATTNGTYDKVTFGTVKIIRSMKADDTWNSLCLPFSMNEEQITEAFGEDTDVRELTTASVTGTAPDEVLHLNFTQVTAIEAGKLYMVRVPAAISEFYVEDTEVDTAEPVQDYSKDGYTIQTHSNYNYMEGTTNGYVPVGSFVISSNKFMQVGSSTQKMKAFRGYITATDASGNPVKALGIGFIDPLTGINNVEFNTDARIYNLQGLQQSKLQKGINIVNGKKVIR